MTRALAGLALSGALVVAPTAVQAQTLSHADARADVAKIVDLGDRTGSIPAPDQANGDIVGIRFRHTKTRIQIRVRFVDLQRVGAQHATGVLVMTNEGVKRRILLSAEPGHWTGTVSMYSRAGARLRCAIYHTIDYSANAVTIGLPRTCLSLPRWVQIGARHNWTPTEQRSYFVDDALRNEDVGPYQYLRLSPRIYRG